MMYVHEIEAGQVEAGQVEAGADETEGATGRGAALGLGVVGTCVHCH